MVRYFFYQGDERDGFSKKQFEQDQYYQKLIAARSGDHLAMNQLITHYEPEIRKIACKYFLPRADYEDLLQEGRIAIFKAIKSYNPASKIPFYIFYAWSLNVN